MNTLIFQFCLPLSRNVLTYPFSYIDLLFSASQEDLKEFWIYFSPYSHQWIKNEHHGLNFDVSKRNITHLIWEDGCFSSKCLLPKWIQHVCDLMGHLSSETLLLGIPCLQGYLMAFGRNVTSMRKNFSSDLAERDCSWLAQRLAKFKCTDVHSDIRKISLLQYKIPMN